MSIPLNEMPSAIGKCVLEESMGFGVGIVVGTALALRTKKLYHVMALTTVGAGLDMVYARSVKCRPLIEAYDAALEAEEKRKKDEIRPGAKPGAER